MLISNIIQNIYFALQNGGWCNCESSKRRYSKYGRKSCGSSGGPWCNYVYETLVVQTKKQFCYAKVVAPLPSVLKSSDENKPSSANSCSELRTEGWPSGNYKIGPNSNANKDALCDMDIDKGGWTLIASAHQGILGQDMANGVNTVSSPNYISDYASKFSESSDEAVIAWGDKDSTSLSSYSKIYNFTLIISHMPYQISLYRV